MRELTTAAETDRRRGEVKRRHGIRRRAGAGGGVYNIVHLTQYRDSV